MPKLLERRTDDELAADLRRIWYSPSGFGGAQATLDKLRKEGKTASIPRIKKWLAKQEIVQAVKKTEKQRSGLRFSVGVPNEMHQIDLLALPNDHGYKYAMVLVDAATRYKAAVPLKTKTSKEVADALDSIYTDRKSPLKPPTLLVCDEGGEFKGEVATLMAEHKTRIRRSQPGHHRGQAFAEAFNRNLATRIFKYQDVQERQKSGEVNRTWVSILPEMVAAFNSEKTRLIGMSPEQAMKLPRVRQPTPLEGKTALSDMLPYGARARIRMSAEDQQGGVQRATDRKWSKKIYNIKSVLVSPDGPPLYFIEGQRHGFPAESLQVVRGIPEEPPIIAPPRAPASGIRRRAASAESAIGDNPIVWASARGRSVRRPARLR